MKAPQLLLIAAIVLQMPTSSQAEPIEIQLWPADHPANAGEGDRWTEGRPNRLTVRHSPTLYAYLPEENPTGAAIMICPGGGYSVLAIDHEGAMVAKWLNERGVAAFVLYYRCGGGVNQHPAPLNDANRAMRLIRSREEEWKIEPDKLGVMGFSAGGHLASSVSTLYEEGVADSADVVDTFSSRPAFSVLVYPVISMEEGVGHGGSRRQLLGENPDAELVEKMTTYNNIHKNTPPAVLFHALDDKAVIPENSKRYHEKLLECDVPSLLTLYKTGGHGFGMLKRDAPSDQWTTELEAWLVDTGMMQPQEQVGSN